jgi:hypothetical protein
MPRASYFEMLRLAETPAITGIPDLDKHILSFLRGKSVADFFRADNYYDREEMLDSVSVHAIESAILHLLYIDYECCDDVAEYFSGYITYEARLTLASWSIHTKDVYFFLGVYDTFSRRETSYLFELAFNVPWYYATQLLSIQLR